MSTVDVSELDALSIAELEDEIATLASHMNAGMCRWLELVAERDRRGEWWDCTCTEWLAWRCAIEPRTAREHVRVARCLPELPLIRAAFARGELSYSKVRALTRIADAGCEEKLLPMARGMTASQLERAVRAYRRVTTAEANAVHDGAYVTTFWEEDGSLAIHGRLAPEDGAVFVKAMDAARDALWQRERGSAEPRTWPGSAETIVAMAEASLASGGARSSGERYQVVVHVDAEALGGNTDGGCAVDDGPSVAPETARRLACDCSIVTIRERDGIPLSVGRKTRSIPPGLRRALNRRDGRCRFPGCEHRLWLHGHHIEHWIRGGETRLDNLLLLCSRHHRLVHEGGYHVDDQMRFYNPWGQEIPAVAKPPPGDAAELLRHEHASTIGPHTCASGEGERMDLELQVEAIASVTGYQWEWS